MLIGARTAAWSDGKKFSALDYVGAKSASEGEESPLIAMWDGIENAGWGVHSNIVNWDDLVGGKRIGLKSSPTVIDDGVMFSKSNGAYGAFEISFVHIELVGTLRSVSSFNCAFSIRNGNNTKGCIWGSRSTGEHLSFVGSVVVSNQTDVQLSLSGVAESKNGFWVNSIFKPGSVSGWDGSYHPYGIRIGNYTAGWVTESTVNSIRLYNRQLTQEEISANYAVDKARFNLP